MLLTLCEMGEESIHLLARTVINEKLEKERFVAAGTHCRCNLQFEVFKPSFGTLRQRNVVKCVQQGRQRAAWFLSLSKTVTSLTRGFVCRCRGRLLNCLVYWPKLLNDKFSDLSVTNLMSRFFLMTAHTREFPMIHKIIDIDETTDVTTSSNLDMAASIRRSLWITHCKQAIPV